jgi:hypothetical protein
LISSGKDTISAYTSSDPPGLITSGSKQIKFMTITIKAQEIYEKEIFVDKLIFERLGNAPDDIIEQFTLEIVEKSIAHGKMAIVNSERRIFEFNNDKYFETEIEDYPSLSAPQAEVGQNYTSNTIDTHDVFYNLDLDPPIVVSEGIIISVDVLLDISTSASSSNCVGLKLNDVQAEDWEDVIKIPDTDENYLFNPNLNIQNYALQSDSNKLNMYFDVEGQLLSAGNLPIRLLPINNKLKTEPVPLKDENPKSDKKQTARPNIPIELIEKDTLRVFLDTDQNVLTGYNPGWLPLGAEFMMEITGREGIVTNRAIFRYSNLKNEINTTSEARHEWSWDFISKIPAAKDHSKLESSINFKLLNFKLETGINIFYILSNWDETITDSSQMLNIGIVTDEDILEMASERDNQYINSLIRENIVKITPPEHSTRASNPYESSHVHPIDVNNDDGSNLDAANVDEDSPGDGTYEKSGKDLIYSWIECEFGSANIPIGSTINNLTIYMGFYNDINWNLTATHTGLIWSTSSGGTEHDIVDYEISTVDTDKVYTTTTDLPGISELNNGIFMRASGFDNASPPWDEIYLDYLYFTVNYSIPNIIISEVMFDPTGSDDGAEWVELYNAGSTGVDLTGWNITDNDGNRFSLSNAGVLPAGEYLVCYIGASGINSSNELYGPIIKEMILQPGGTGIDNYLNSVSNDTNFGSDDALRIENATLESRILIQFDLSTISQTGMIDSTLSLYKYDGHSKGDAVVSVHRVTNSWTESGSTWNRSDGIIDWPVNNDGGDFVLASEDSITVKKGVNGWYSIDISELTKAWKNGTYQNYGIILIGGADSKFQLFYSSDYAGDSSLRPKLIVNSWNYTTKSILDNSDDLTLISSNNDIIDYLAWGSDPGLDDDAAVTAGQWTDGEFIDTSLFVENETLARDLDCTDTDSVSDWENASSTADPYGVNATAPTPGEMNKDVVIPEFDILAIPILFVAILFLCFNRSYDYWQNSKNSQTSAGIKQNKKRKKLGKKRKGNNNGRNR